MQRLPNNMHYTKMHGAGNSFILIENLHGELQSEDLGVLALHLCKPNTGPGADGFIALIPSDSTADFGMLFYNADGSPGEMCGNGARCAARYGFEHGLSSNSDNIRILATAGLVTGRRITQEDYEIRLNNPSVIDLHRRVAAGNETVSCSYIELGRPGIPHAVVQIDPAKICDPESLRVLAVALRYNPSFPKGANITFVAAESESCIRAITYERGVEDFTLACGTGCGAAAVSLMLSGAIKGNQLDILMPGGKLHIHMLRKNNSIKSIFLTGPTAIVSEGEFPIDFPYTVKTDS